MDDLLIPAGNETPAIEFRYSSHRLSISGESYPENAMAFYGPIRAGLQDYLEKTPAESPLDVHIGLRYFNSSSTKLIRALIGMLDAKARAGRKIILHWLHDEDDDMMREFGEDLREEYEGLDFRATTTALA